VSSERCACEIGGLGSIGGARNAFLFRLRTGAGGFNGKATDTKFSRVVVQCGLDSRTEAIAEEAVRHGTKDMYGAYLTDEEYEERRQITGKKARSS